MTTENVYTGVDGNQFDISVLPRILIYRDSKLGWDMSVYTGEAET